MEGFSLKWGWYHTFNVIAASNGYFGLEKVEREPLGSILYWLAYQSDLGKVMNPKK